MKASFEDLGGKNNDYEDVEWAIRIMRSGGISEGYGGTSVCYHTLRSNIRDILRLDRAKRKKKK